ncbi:MAG: hypothetical protein V3S01_00320 [Dehalococcoidia bacterium]
MLRVVRKNDLSIAIRREEISRLLGYGDRQVPARVRRLLMDVEKEAQALLRPVSARLEMDAAAMARSPFLRDLDAVVVCLVTIGPALEEAVKAHHHAGELGRSLVLNAYGSAAVEVAADAANEIIRRDVERRELLCSRRFSPGYGGWDVSEQRWIVEALEAERLAVSLTEGCMMVPHKSITFAVNTGTNPVEMRHDNACDGCGLATCDYRRRTVVTEEKGKTCTTFVGPESNFCPRDKWS